MARRLLVRKLTPNQSPLLSTRWVLASFDTDTPDLQVESYHHNFYDAITTASLMITEATKMASGTFNIEVPKPVIEVEVDYNPAGLADVGEWHAKVSAGGVVLMEGDYSSDYLWDERVNRFIRPENYVTDSDGRDYVDLVNAKVAECAEEY